VLVAAARVFARETFLLEDHLRFVAALGELDIVMNNAGYGAGEAFLEMREATWDTIRNPGDHHTRIAVSHEDHMLQIFRLNEVDHILNVSIESNLRDQERCLFSYSRKCRCIDGMTCGL